LPISTPWLDNFVSEFSLFPASKNDDQVDALTMAINYSLQRVPPQMTEVTWGRGDRVIEGVKSFNIW
jgi:phage terminase large subunit-like protein